MISYGPYMITNGLALLADASSTRSYPGTGSTWSDISNNGNNLTLNGTTVFNFINPYSGGESIITDGSTSYLSSFYVCNAPFTLSFTTRVLSFASNYLVHTTGTGLVSGFTIRIINSTTLSVTFYKAGGVTQTVSITTPNITSLPCAIDLVVSATGSGSIYVNGVLRDSSLSGYTTPADASFAQSLVFGGYNNSGSFVASASAHFLRAAIYNRALTVLEIKTNFNALQRRYSVITSPSTYGSLIISYSLGTAGAGGNGVVGLGSGAGKGG
jgi:hypothetical protein